ncbi:MAG: hypothetical protein AAF434_20700 [Pseudomonadota bacterium]
MRVEKIAELQNKLNLQNLVVWSNFPNVPHAAAMNSIKLFTEEVMPRFNQNEEKQSAA